MDEAVGRSRTIDESFEHGVEQRRQPFGHRVRQQRPPARGNDRDDADPNEYQSASEPASQIVEDECDLLEQRCLDLAHPIGPVLLDRKRLDGYEQGKEHKERQESSSQPQLPPRAKEKALASQGSVGL